MAKKEKSLPDLPKSEDNFWLGEVELKEIKQRKCDHEFTLVDRSLKCMKCNMGLYINVDDDFRDGHLYHKGKFVI